jgi:hypothetical protein
MGRAMLIICAGILISLGFVAMSTSNTGKMLTKQNVNYAEYTMAKNAAHTAIQIAMQEINKDNDWPTTHNQNNPWVTTIQGREVALFTEIYNNPDYWEPDSLWIFSNAEYLSDVVQVRTLYLKQPFSSLVPEFEGALTIAADPDKFNFSMGGSSYISGDGPTGCENKPAITTLPGASSKIDVNPGSGPGNNRRGVDGDPMVNENPDLSYQPTDELIARLANTDGVQYISGNYKGDFGSPENPGVFFIEDHARLTGGIPEGYGIMVIRSGGSMEMEDETGASLDVAGNFKFNGLIVFENAYNFTGRGTPTINGSILVGHTTDYPDHMPPIDIDVSGNISIQYDCNAEQYAKMAAANAVQQNKYSRIVSSENIRYPSNQGGGNGNGSGGILDKLKNLF